MHSDPCSILKRYGKQQLVARVHCTTSILFGSYLDTAGD